MSRSILVALLVALFSESQAASPKVTGVFSNMRFGTEDVTGVEVFVTYSDKGHFAQVQCAEGAISRPVVVPVLVAGSYIEFAVPADSTPNAYSCPVGKFKGEVSAKGLRGRFEGTDWPGFLKRAKSYWQ
jgi:hypothetical protein